MCLFLVNMCIYLLWYYLFKEAADSERDAPEVGQVRHRLVVHHIQRVATMERLAYLARAIGCGFPLLPLGRSLSWGCLVPACLHSST